MILDELVDELTVPHTVTTTMDDGTKKRVSHAGLIPQLRAAVASSVTGHSGGSSSGVGLPINSDAYTLHRNIETHIGVMVVDELGEVPGLYPELNLRMLWGRRWRFGDAPAGLLWRWRSQILDLLDGGRAVKRHRVQFPCPVCGVSSWGDMYDGGGVWPVEVVRRFDDHDLLTSIRAACLAPGCGAVWDGLDAIAELDEEIQEKHGGIQ